MKYLLFMAASLLQVPAFTQSPFNYGRNKQLYFISAEQRKILKMDTIRIIEQQAAGETGGMHENWDLQLISFSNERISDEWSPLYLDSNYKFSFNSFSGQTEVLNGTYYDFEAGKLIAYGGEGYGSFNHIDITRFADTVSITALSCAGHCGYHPLLYAKHVFDSRGKLLYRVYYPRPDDSEDSAELASLEEYEQLFESFRGEDYMPDTFYFKYDRRGLLLKENDEVFISDSSQVRQLFAYTDTEHLSFHQCYVGKVKMETYFRQKLGYAPALVLLEIYRLGVFSFYLNPVDKKYYRGRTLILEK